MGLTNSKDILTKIENDYKPQPYGEITIIQHKQTKQTSILIEKHFIQSNHYLQQFLTNNLRSNYFLKVEKYQFCKVSVCSDIKLENSLQMQIGRRQREGRRFNEQEVLFILLQQVQIVTQLNLYEYYQNGQHYKYILKNNKFLCSDKLNLSIIQPMLRNDPQQQYQNESQFYSSPQAYVHLKRSQILKFKQLCVVESSVVFTMGLNFIQCLLLADISIFYQQHEFNYNKLYPAIQQIYEEYGPQISNLIIKMTSPQPNKRISLQQLKIYLRSQKRKYRKIKNHQKQLFLQ